MSMTEKGFIKKAQGKVSAAAFIAEHRQWLTTGTLACMTTPILAKLDNGEIFPTPALKDLTKAVMDHMIARSIGEGQAKLSSSGDKGSSVARTPKAKEPGRYTAKIFNGAGVPVMQEECEDEGKAQGWCDRKLEQDGGPGWYGMITSNLVINGKMDTYTRTIKREDSLVRVLKTRNPGQATKTVSSSGGKWKMRAKGDHFHFSRG